eukprot:75684_1
MYKHNGITSESLALFWGLDTYLNIDPVLLMRYGNPEFLRYDGKNYWMDPDFILPNQLLSRYDVTDPMDPGQRRHNNEQRGIFQRWMNKNNDTVYRPDMQSIFHAIENPVTDTELLRERNDANNDIYDEKDNNGDVSVGSINSIHSISYLDNLIDKFDEEHHKPSQPSSLQVEISSQQQLPAIPQSSPDNRFNLLSHHERDLLMSSQPQTSSPENRFVDLSQSSRLMLMSSQPQMENNDNDDEYVPSEDDDDGIVPRMESGTPIGKPSDVTMNIID